MVVGILKESEGENRVSFLPEHGAALTKQKVSLLIENNAGKNAFANDETYADKGFQTAPRKEVLQSSDILLSINLLSDDDLKEIKPNTILIGVYQPLFNFDFIKSCAEKNISVFSLDMLPRTTRAQSMDVLSSQANIAGYKAVLYAASIYPKYFPMFMTAAGSIAPAKVLILGAGVAGLQAVATARRLGAVVEVFDTRPAVKEEVMSLGAKFIEVEGGADASKAGGYAVEQTDEYKVKQQERIAASVAKADIIITTAQIFGKTAPVLISEEILNNMKNGSVIIDIAASTGGNTAKTENNKAVKYKGVTIIGNSFLASEMPSDASKLYGKNVLNFLQLIINKEGNINLNFEDDLVKGSCMTHNGEIISEMVKKKLTD